MNGKNEAAAHKPSLLAIRRVCCIHLFKTLIGREHYFSGQMNAGFLNIPQINVTKRTLHPVKRIFSAERLSTERGAPGFSLQKSLCGQLSGCFTSQRVAFQRPALLPPRDTGELSCSLSATTDLLGNKDFQSCFVSFFSLFFVFKSELS